MACAAWSPAHVALVRHSCCLLVYLHTPHSHPTLPNHHHPHDDSPPHTLTTHRHCNLDPGPRSPRPSPWHSSQPSLRAAKVAKAAAAVANSSSSPVKELRDLSAMDAFRSRSISVSEHAVRRLEMSLLGNQTKINYNPNTSLVASSMGWLMGCRVIVMRGRWAGVGWCVARDTWSGWCMLEEGLCVDHFSFVLGCDHTRAVFRFSSYDLLLHAVFTDDIGKHLHPCRCFSVWFCSNTDFAFIFIEFKFFLVWLCVWLYVFFVLFCWVLCWLVLIGLNNKWMGGTGEKHAYPKGWDVILIVNKCNTILPPFSWWEGTSASSAGDGDNSNTTALSACFTCFCFFASLTNVHCCYDHGNLLILGF